jgi:hypothetical protein
MAGRVEKVGGMMDHILTVVMVTLVSIVTVICGVVFILIGVSIYQSATAETFALRADQWTCTKHEVRRVPMPIMVGKVLVTNYRDSTVCTQWTEKP